MKKGLLSIIVPVYNSEKYLSILIDSLLAQTYTDTEILLIDDGSKDGSGKICDDYAEKDARIKAIHKENGGQSAARDFGLKLAAGEYIAFADNDDYVHPDAYSVMINALEKYGLDLAICLFEHFTDADYPKVSARACRKDLPIEIVTQNQLVDKIMQPTFTTPIWNKVYRASLIENLSFENRKLGEDNMFSYRVYKNVKNAVFIKEALYFQRIHGNNFEFTGNRFYVDLLLTKEEILRDIKVNFKKIYRRKKVEFIEETVRIFNGYCDLGKDYEEERDKTFKILKRNLQGILFLPTSLGRKMLFFKLKQNRQRKNKIVI